MNTRQSIFIVTLFRSNNETTRSPEFLRVKYKCYEPTYDYDLILLILLMAVPKAINFE